MEFPLKIQILLKERNAVTDNILHLHLSDQIISFKITL